MCNLHVDQVFLSSPQYDCLLVRSVGTILAYMYAHDNYCYCAHLSVYCLHVLFSTGELGSVTKITNTTNCTGTLIQWEPPPSLGLPISNYTYRLERNGTTVDSGVSFEPQLLFNTSVLTPNDANFVLSVWAWGPPGQGTGTNTSVVSAIGKVQLKQSNS